MRISEGESTFFMNEFQKKITKKSKQRIEFNIKNE